MKTTVWSMTPSRMGTMYVSLVNLVLTADHAWMD